LATSILSLERVNAFYGDSHVLHDVSLALSPGRLLALLGRNGAGKSTCMHAVVGFLPPRSGRIRIGERELQAPRRSDLPPRRGLRAAGPAHLPDAHRAREPGGRGAAPRASRRRQAWTREDVQQIFPRLKEREKQLAGSLSGGEQQMLAVGRALMTSPRVLLLDEPSEGLAPQIVRELGNVLADLKKEISILLVEQNLGLAMKLADDVVLLNTGRVVFSGSRDAFEQQQDRAAAAPRRALKEREMKEGEARIGRYTLRYVEAGQGPAIVLIHGLAGDLHAWSAQLALLKPHFRIVAFDNRGAGRSTQVDEPVSTRDLAADTLGLMDHLGIAHAQVVGRSMGGAIAQHMR
jgi:branched-chain amino acid transport system ATP-binding protein